MKGYKALDKNMEAVYGNGVQLKLGKKYTVKGDIVPCRNGFHFCEKIEYLNCCYDIKDSRIFEIEADGNIKKDKQKYAAESICLIKELSKEEIRNYFQQNYQAMIDDEDWRIRVAVAEQGYGLDVLVHDEDCDVRLAVAQQGYGLDVLVHDQNFYVSETAKEMVARNKVGDVE